MKNNQDFVFVDKAVYFPEKGIVVIGDLHLGYENMLIKSGVLTPRRQNKKIISDLRKIFDKIKNIKQDSKLNKIIFLGDIKHGFSFEKAEKFEFREVYEFLQEYFDARDIIFIKGNHDTIDYSFSGKLKNYYVSKEKDIAFIHGHKTFPELYDKKIKTIVMGHIHPSVLFKDKHTSKKEKYKCFLVGKFKNKKVIILPSFLGISIGAPVNEYDNEYGYEDYFSIISKKSILNFNVYVIGEEEIFEFGKVKSL